MLKLHFINILGEYKNYRLNNPGSPCLPAHVLSKMLDDIAEYWSIYKTLLDADTFLEVCNLMEFVIKDITAEINRLNEVQVNMKFFHNAVDLYGKLA